MIAAWPPEVLDTLSRAKRWWQPIIPPSQIGVIDGPWRELCVDLDALVDSGLLLEPNADGLGYHPGAKGCLIRTFKLVGHWRWSDLPEMLDMANAIVVLNPDAKAARMARLRRETAESTSIFGTGPNDAE